MRSSSERLEKLKEEILDFAHRWYAVGGGYTSVPLSREVLMISFANEPHSYEEIEIETAVNSLIEEQKILEANTPDGEGLFVPRKYNLMDTRKAVLKVMKKYPTGLWGPSKALLEGCLTPYGHTKEQIEHVLRNLEYENEVKTENIDGEKIYIKLSEEQKQRLRTRRPV
jgi:hypothetical protein